MRKKKTIHQIMSFRINLNCFEMDLMNNEYLLILQISSQFYCVTVLRAPKYGTSAALKAAAGPAGAAVCGA